MLVFLNKETCSKQNTAKKKIIKKIPNIFKFFKTKYGEKFFENAKKLQN